MHTSRLIRLSESRIFWPLVLFPYTTFYAHTWSFTGRCWVKDIKASFSFARLILSENSLTCRYRLFNRLLFDLPLQNIDDVKKIEGKPGLIEIQFHSADYGGLANFALAGQPPGSKNRVIINVTDDQRWLNELSLYVNI